MQNDHMGTTPQSQYNPTTDDYNNSENQSSSQHFTEDPIHFAIMDELDLLEKDIIKDRLAKKKIFKQPLKSVSKEENLNFHEGIYDAIAKANLEEI